MKDCVDSTTLRSHLDHPEATLDAHLDVCGDCSGLLRAVAADAGEVRQALALLDAPPVVGAPAAVPEVDVESALSAAYLRLAADAVPLPVGVFVGSPRRTPGLRRLVLAGAVALVVLAVATTPTGRGAVAQALDAFRGERLQVVVLDAEAIAQALTPADLEALQALGDVDLGDLADPVEVVDLAAAEALAGIAAPTLDPASGTPDILLALAPGTARLVLVARDGNGVPAELDGATLLVDVPGAIGALHAGADDAPELIIARSGIPVIRAEGAPLEDVRAFLLARDELPAALRDQLAAIDDWRTTIPVPVPLDGPGWVEVEVAGRPAIAFGDDSGLGALVVRSDADGVTLVGGRMGISRALELAAGA